MECFELIHNKGKDSWSQKIFLTFKKCNVLKKNFSVPVRSSESRNLMKSGREAYNKKENAFLRYLVK